MNSFGSPAWLCLSNKCFLVDPYLVCRDLQDRAEGKHTSAHVYISVSLPALFSEKVRNMSPDEIRIPPEPPGRCSSQLQVDTPLLIYRLSCPCCTLLISTQYMLSLSHASSFSQLKPQLCVLIRPEKKSAWVWLELWVLYELNRKSWCLGLCVVACL